LVAFLAADALAQSKTAAGQMVTSKLTASRAAPVVEVESIDRFTVREDVYGQ
jgi:hypothetical protein